MEHYDDAERFAMKELDPAGFLAWLLMELDRSWEYSGWVESQATPLRGLQLRGDCVAALTSAKGEGPPFACLIEAQAQPKSHMGVRMITGMGLLYQQLRHGSRDQDRFRMMGAILNLTDSGLQDEIDWLVPVTPGEKPDAEQVAREKAQPAQAKDEIPLGLRARFFIRNVRKESARETLNRIESKLTALCILAWIPLMFGGDDPLVIEHWKRLVLTDQRGWFRATLVELVLIFAELAERYELWKSALEGFDMMESRIAKAYIEQGIEKGIEKGTKQTLVRHIHFTQKLMKQPQTPEADLLAMPLSALEQLTALFEQQALAAR